MSKNAASTDTLYLGFAIEWADYMDAYRIYDPRRPQQTMAYADTMESAKQHLQECFGGKNDRSNPAIPLSKKE